MQRSPSFTYRLSLWLGVALLIPVLIAVPTWGDDAKAEKEEPSPAHSAAVEKIQEAGGAVRRIAQNSNDNEVSLALASDPIEDEILASVADVDNVIWLELQGTAITDEGLKHLAGMKKLTRLHLERTGITDEGLKHLAGLTELEYLNVYGTKITDAGLDQLKSLEKLRKVFVWQTEVTDEGMAALAKAMPELAVVGAAKPMVEPPPMPKKEVAEFIKKEIKAPEKLLGEGIAVRITLPAAQFLSLAEVEVYTVGEKDKWKGEATQSTTGHNGPAELAIDGNRDGDHSAGSVTHTENSEGEWWKVTFPEKKEIGAIHIWNRTDCCGERLVGAVVEILDEDEEVTWTGEIESEDPTYEFVGE